MFMNPMLTWPDATYWFSYPPTPQNLLHARYYVLPAKATGPPPPKKTTVQQAILDPSYRPVISLKGAALT